MQKRSTYLFVKSRVVSDSILDVEVPAPVHYHHRQGQGEEPDDEDAGLTIASIQQAEHGQEEQEPQEDVQIPAQQIIIH